MSASSGQVRRSVPAVSYAAGPAEHIPLTDASCDAALLFFVWHHVDDRERAAQRLKLRAVSVFEHMSEAVVEAGFRPIDAALPSLGDGPQFETSNLLVLSARGLAIGLGSERTVARAQLGVI